MRRTVRNTINRGTILHGTVEEINLGLATVKIANSKSRMTNLVTMSKDIQVGDKVIVDHSAGGTPAVRKSQFTQDDNTPTGTRGNFVGPADTGTGAGGDAHGYFMYSRDYYDDPPLIMYDGEWWEVVVGANAWPTPRPIDNIAENGTVWRVNTDGGDVTLWYGTPGATASIPGRYLVYFTWNDYQGLIQPDAGFPFQGVKEAKVEGSGQEGMTSTLIGHQKARLLEGYENLPGINSVWLTGRMPSPYFSLFVRYTCHDHGSPGPGAIYVEDLGGGDFMASGRAFGIVRIPYT